MKRFASSLAVALVLVCVLLGSGPASAHQSVPASTDCHTSQCSSYGYWNGTTYGGVVQFTVSGPGFFSSPASWDRYMRLGSGNPKMIVGIFSSVGGGYGNYCSGAGSGLKYGFYAYDDTGFNIDNYCKSVPASDVNHDVYISVTDFTNACPEPGYYAVHFGFADFSDNQCQLQENMGNSFNRMQEQEDIHDYVSGHQVWGSHWLSSQYVTNTGGFAMQTRDYDSRTHRDPPQFYWNHVPSTSYPGGELYACVYATGSTCTYGS